MKRLKFKLKKYYKTKRSCELKYLSKLFLKKSKNFLPSPFSVVFSLFLNKDHLHTSKLKKYCLITGRVHYTIKLCQISRHKFFELCREGFIAGFFFK